MIRYLVFIAVLLTAPAASAQQPSQPPPTVDEIAAAKAHADDVIARAEAQDYFENVTTDAVPTVRHTASGMTCTFSTGDTRDNIRFYSSGPDGPARGDDVSCGGWLNTTFLSLFATRYPDRPSRDAVFHSAMADVPRNTPGAELVQGEFTTVSIGGRAAPLIGVYHMQLGGQPKQSFVLADQIDEWTFQARGTGLVDDTTVNLLSAMGFALSLPGARELVRR